MKITEIQIVPIKPENGLIAFASVIFDDNLYLGFIGIHTRLSGTGYRITYPTKKIASRDINVYHPINKEASKAIEDAIISRAEAILGHQGLLDQY